MGLSPAGFVAKWYEDSAEDAIDAEERLSGDPLAQPEPEYEYDQRVSW